MVRQYLEHSKAILGSEESRFKFNERRSQGRIYLFGYQNKYDLQEGFPLLTTKKVGFKTLTHELIWFMSGGTNIKYLVDNNVHIWDDDAFNHNLKAMAREEVFSEAFPKDSKQWKAARDEYVQRVKEDAGFAQRWGDLGPVYGSQWMHWPSFTPTDMEAGGQERYYTKELNGINQIDSVIAGMKKDPKSARYVVTAWNPQEVPNMALPPCHTLFQLNSDGERLDLQMYQRACDMFLGVPFNIASYALLTTILAQEIGLEPGQLVHTFGDVHFYTGKGERAKWYKEHFDEFKGRAGRCIRPNDYGELLSWLNPRLPPEEKEDEGRDHVTGILEQLTRAPRDMPRVKIANKPYNQLTIDDFVLEGYDPWPKIERTLSV